MNLDKETQEKIQELQILEQNLQQVTLQEQAFQQEIHETDSALSEIEKTSEDVYKIVGNIMIKIGKADISKELKEKKDILSLRLNSIEKQSSSLREKTEKLREEVVKSMKA
ncbi:MAG: prefoldin subunit beta [Nanoarchaeota archaeon]|nr:prefoldin subunit beta [Nanoarchaeota archaeon]